MVTTRGGYDKPESWLPPQLVYFGKAQFDNVTQKRYLCQNTIDMNPDEIIKRAKLVTAISDVLLAHEENLYRAVGASGIKLTRDEVALIQDHIHSTRATRLMTASIITSTILNGTTGSIPNGAHSAINQHRNELRSGTNDQTTGI